MLALAAALVLTFTLAPRATHARSRLQGVGQASVGYSDNVRSAPDEPVFSAECETAPESEECVQLVAARQADAFLVLSPGVVYAIERPEASHRFGYTYTANLFFDTSETNSYSNRFEWRGFMDVSPRLSLSFNAGATQAHRHIQNTIGSASQSALTAMLPGTGAYVLALFGENARYVLSPDWRLTQGFGAGAQVPIFGAEGSRSFNFSARLGIERVFEWDAVGAEARTNYVVYLEPGTTQGERERGERGDQTQLISEGVGTWRHDFGMDFSSRLEAGAAHVLLINRDRELWQPVGSAALAYSHENGEASLSYRRAVTSSVFFGRTFISDSVRLSGAIPLDDKEKWFLSGALGYQHSRILEADGSFATKVRLGLGDLAVSYRVLNEVELAARYQHIEQLSDADDFSYSIDDPLLPLSYVRNTALVTVTVEYPPDREMPRQYREPRRIDESDSVDSSYDDPTQNQPAGTPMGGFR